MSKVSRFSSLPQTIAIVIIWQVGWVVPATLEPFALMPSPAHAWSKVPTEALIWFGACSPITPMNVDGACGQMGKVRLNGWEIGRGTCTSDRAGKAPDSHQAPCAFRCNIAPSQLASKPRGRRGLRLKFAVPPHTVHAGPDLIRAFYREWYSIKGVRSGDRGSCL